MNGRIECDRDGRAGRIREKRKKSDRSTLRVLGYLSRAARFANRILVLALSFSLFRSFLSSRAACPRQSCLSSAARFSFHKTTNTDPSSPSYDLSPSLTPHFVAILRARNTLYSYIQKRQIFAHFYVYSPRRCLSRKFAVPTCEGIPYKSWKILISMDLPWYRAYVVQTRSAQAPILFLKPSIYPGANTFYYFPHSFVSIVERKR